uniref:Uncharacterized protein n=1 Tax=Dulem virus 224 TaxID=3145701 RepID=A0AAU8B384_9VIRU
MKTEDFEKVKELANNDLANRSIGRVIELYLTPKVLKSHYRTEKEINKALKDYGVKEKVTYTIRGKNENKDCHHVETVSQKAEDLKNLENVKNITTRFVKVLSPKKTKYTIFIISTNFND